MIRNIHHINFLVRDLDRAVERYRRLLGDVPLVHEDLPRRGVRTARFRVGETWLVLLQPYEKNNVPGRHLEQHGEGFFLLSFESADLDEDASRLGEAGIVMADAVNRRGLDGWEIRDLDPGGFFGVNLQLTGARKD